MPHASSPPALSFGPARAARLRKVHRLSAALVGAFVLLHLGNHLAGLAGQDMHRSVQHALRWLYRGWLEPVLLAACVLQIVTGLRLVWQRRASLGRGGAQPLSGLYLALFLGIHLVAVLQARLRGIDTDLAFAAAGLHAGAWKFFFAPYYALAVLAFGVHLSVPIGRRSRRLGRAVVLASAALAVVLVWLLAGLITPLHIAPELIEAFAQPLR